MGFGEDMSQVSFVSQSEFLPHIAEIMQGRAAPTLSAARHDPPLLLPPSMYWSAF
jgi:hypothetical protein